MYCRFCDIPMKSVMSFEGENMKRFYRCPKCWWESRQYPLFLSGIVTQQTTNRDYKKKTKGVHKKFDYQR